MSNLNDYLIWRGDLTLDHALWCEVDSLIMACLSYIKLNEAADASVALHDIVNPEGFDDKLVNRFFRKCRALFDQMAQSARYGHMVLHDYVDILDDEGVKQFSAVTADLPDGISFVAFRGTDSTITGWREDFHMAFESPVPAQSEALAYLIRAAEKTDRPLRLGGHSKGGNLAAYAAAHAPAAVQDRILSISSFDGPGLDDDTMAGEGYRRISSRVVSVIPESSVVGLMLNYHTDYTVVKSDSVGVLQHDPFTWQLHGPAFECADSVTDASRLLDETLHDWLKRCTPEERREFVDTVFDLLASTNARSFADLTDEKLHSLGAILSTARGMTFAEIINFLRLSGEFVKIGAGNVIDRLRGDEHDEDSILNN